MSNFAAVVELKLNVLIGLLIFHFQVVSLKRSKLVPKLLDINVTRKRKTRTLSVLSYHIQLTSTKALLAISVS